MKKIIVTGGLGFIGSNLIKLLIKKNYFVINVDKVSYASNFYNKRDSLLVILFLIMIPSFNGQALFNIKDIPFSLYVIFIGYV